MGGINNQDNLFPYDMPTGQCDIGNPQTETSFSYKCVNN